MHTCTCPYYVFHTRSSLKGMPSDVSYHIIQFRLHVPIIIHYVRIINYVYSNTCACGIHVFYTFCMYLLVKIRHAKFYQITFQSVYVFILSSVQSSLRYVSHYICMEIVFMSFCVLLYTSVLYNQ